MGPLYTSFPNQIGVLIKGKTRKREGGSEIVLVGGGTLDKEYGKDRASKCACLEMVKPE